MTQGPWSIKGIDPRARSAARETALRRGVTLGEYLNSLLLDEEAVRVDGVDVAEFHASEAAPDEMRRMSAEIDLLAQRLEASSARAARGLASVDKSILGVLGKLDVSNKAQLSGLERISRAMSDIEATQTALRARIDAVEAKDAGGQTLSALKALEASLGRLAETVHERDAAIARDQADFHDLFEQKVGLVSERVESISRGLDTAVGDAVRSTQAGITGRVDHIEQQLQAAERRMEGALGRITEAASRFELFESKTERAVTDTTWRMERALESSVARSRAMSKDLLDRVDSIEEKTRDAIGALGDAVGRITERIGRAERSSGQAIGALERTVAGLDDRLAKMPSGDVSEIKTLFQKRLDTLADDLSRPIHAVRADVERRVEEALRSSQQPEKLEQFERLIRGLQQRLEAAESRQAGAVETISSQLDRMSRAVDDRLKTVENRADDRSIEDVRREMLRLAETIDGRLNLIELSERSTSGAVEKLATEIARVPGLVDERILSSERRSAEAIDAVGDQIVEMAERLQRNHDDGVQRLTARLEETARAGADRGVDEFNRFAQSFDERVRESERRSAEAIGQIGEQVARAAERLQNQHVESLRMLETRLADSGRNHETQLNEALADMSRRMDEIGEQAASSLAPVHKTVSSLARRLAAVEDGETPAPQPSAALEPAIPELTDDFGLMETPAPAVPQAESEDPPSQPVEIEAGQADVGGADVVGVEPPPFDRSPDAHLFTDDEPSFAAVLAESAAAQETEPARAIDEPIEMDDIVFVQRAPPAFIADLPNDDGAPASADYLAEARRAAQQGRRVPIASTTSSGRRGVGRGPLIASAALAVAVVGGGAWTLMRGKQDAAADPFAKTDPSAPAPTSSDPKGAAEVLFGDDAATTAAKPAQPAAAKDAHAELFDATPPWKDNANPSAAPAAGEAAAPSAPEAAPSQMTLAQGVALGDPVALHDQAVELLQGPDKARAVSLLREAAAKGLVMAEYRLAKLYEKGEGAPRDVGASRRWTEQAAMGGNVKAMHDLAVFYAEGDAGPQSYAAAVEWFRQASDLGLVDSQYNLAVLYEQGLGVSEDKAEAAYWYEVAGRSGDPDGIRRANDLESKLKPAEIDTIKRRARAFTPKPSIPRANGDLGKRPWDVASPAQIAETQRLLEKLGYAPGKSDGRVRPATLQAIKQFERDNHLAPTGEPSVPLLGQLKAAALHAS